MTQSTIRATAPTISATASAWPALDVLPRGPKARFYARVTRRIFRTGTHRLGLTWSEDGSPADIRVLNPESFFLRVGNQGLIGFGESYMAGDWDADDLGGTLTVLCTEIADLVPQWMQRMRAAYVSRPPKHQESSTDNSRSNIAHHYDLSNDLFSTFLDPTLSYSSAMFDTDAVTHLDCALPFTRLEAPIAGSPLEEAQARKIEAILDAAGVTAGSRVLEIGTGWGELAIRAARRGATIRSITLSSEQQALALARIAEAGYRDQCEVDLLDYRALASTASTTREQYDAIVSVEMIEAVGFDYWDSYFEVLDHALAPGGKVAIQAITMPHDRMLATRRTYTWINKYIFPGGFLPSTEVMDQITRKHTDLRLTGRTTFGSHYAETLRQWDAAFTGAHDEVLALGFDETFLRMWHFYLEYSRAGFASGYIDVQQLTFAREA
ncbi:MAG: class I SAM-dependent methyltransferase [Marmoricola sp.]